jgi:hypothetical protein
MTQRKATGEKLETTGEPIRFKGQRYFSSLQFLQSLIGTRTGVEKLTPAEYNRKAVSRQKEE